ncbi:MAG: hypothetical protein RR423_06355 [Hydrogenoanaerobacterium sp.]
MKYITNTKIKVPKNIENVKALFLCNFRLDHKLKCFIESLHIRYLNGIELNASFQYASSLELEYGIAITTDNEVETFCNDCKDENLKCHSNYYLLGSGHGCNVKASYKKAYKILEQANNIELAFTFSTSVFDEAPYGTVLYNENTLLPYSKTIEKVNVVEKEYCNGNVYLVIFGEDMSVSIHDIGAG